MRILVIEDEQRLADVLKQGLAEEGYAVDCAHDGEAGLSAAQGTEYDCIVLDWRLPRRSGIDVLRELRRAADDVPVLMLTARESVADRVEALDTGADDYLTKPFAFEELLARIRALLRRGRGGAASVLAIDDLTVDPVTRSVRRGEQPLQLSAREYALLEYFLRNVNRVLSRTVIAEHVWELPYAVNTNIIDVYVRYLREKLDAGSRRPLIHTVRGTGYVMRVDDAAA